jgi:uncharacterized protein (TIGR00725 family)
VAKPLIAVAGGTHPSAREIELAEQLGHALVDAGFRVATGGLAGSMAAVSRGARRSMEWSGSEVLGFLPGWGPAAEGNPWLGIALPTGLGRYRNTLLASSCDALVAIGGGAGTLSELALAWQEGKPLLVLGSEGWAARLGGEVLDHRRPDAVAAFLEVAGLVAHLHERFPLGCFPDRGDLQWDHGATIPPPTILPCSKGSLIGLP